MQVLPIHLFIDAACRMEKVVRTNEQPPPQIQSSSKYEAGYPP